MLNAFPHIGRLLEPSVEALLANSTHIVLTQTPPPVIAEQLLNSGKPLFDIAGTRLLR